jgi:hypothetical protein
MKDHLINLTGFILFSITGTTWQYEPIQSSGAEEAGTNVDGTYSTTQQQSPGQQKDNPDTLVSPEVDNNS